MRLALIITALAGGLSGCGTNPLGSSASQSLPAGVAPLAVTEQNASNVVFRPTGGTFPLLTPAFGGQGLTLSMGRFSYVYRGQSTLANPDGFIMGGGGLDWYGGQFALLLGPYSHLCPTGNCKDLPKYRGVGGPNGDFNSDYFVRWRGRKGSDAALDFSSLQMNFGAGDGTARDLSMYRGLVFWARGHGNFAVSLAGKNGLNAVVGSVQPYTGWNFYLRRFGTELNGDTEWKQIIVFFDDMVQEYGLAADKQLVIQNASGLHFAQEAPFTEFFQLDLDYIQFF
jgi:hypothetical protein